MIPHPDIASIRKADEPTRVRIGANHATTPEVMLELATDPSPVVRGTVAMNRAAPPHVDRALARDSDERVRVLLARKLATLAPSLPEDAQARLQQQALETLKALVADEAVRVRAAIAEEVKGMPDAPRAVILRLAQDSSIMVCEPVIRFSPLLSPADLLALVTSAPSPATAVAVARRADIDERVSDAVAASADSEAIRALLSNHSAQIREATLDSLVARAVEHKDWHEPLVQRPSLPPRATRALSEIVATNLLEVLAARPGFDVALTQDLRERLTARLARDRRSEVPPSTTTESDKANVLDDPLKNMQTGPLEEDMLLDAVRSGDFNMAVAILAVAAEVPVSVVERAASLQSLKGLVSLTWRSGFTMRAATALQALLAKVPPSAVLQAGLGGSFPLTVEEMRWQLDFLARNGR
jgi:uncharacterized protein (DUF2336 family)